MTTNSELLEKIKKLLRLGQSSNAHEAALAMERAFELAARHNIDLADIDLDEETKRILHKSFRVGERFSLIRKCTLGIINTYFNVNVVMDKPNILFIGTEVDVEIATYVHEFLTWSCSKSLRDFQADQRRRLSETKRRSFIAGWMYGVSSKLGEAKEHLAIEESKTALIVQEQKRRDDYMNKNFRTEDVKNPIEGRRNRDALMSGFQEGNKVQINPGLNNKPAERLQLPAPASKPGQQELFA